MDVKNTVAIVTGGTGGIGFATVQALLKNGAQHVAIFDIDASKNKTSRERLNKEFGVGRASVYDCDVTSTNKFSELYDAVVKSHKRVDILINSSGIFGNKEPSLMISVNLTAVINSTLIAIERMGKHKKGRGGTVVNVASIGGLSFTPAYPVYVAAKHGVISFTTSLKETFDHTGVRAMTICPGMTQTPMLSSMRERLDFVDEELFKKTLAPYTHYQSPEHVAEAIVRMIQVGEPGAVWVTEENEPPYAIKDLPGYKERRIPV